jgi:hypothetical protein
VKAETVIKSIQLLSMDGRIVTSSKPDTESTDVNVSTIQSGIYLLMIHTHDGYSIQKIQVVK